MQKRMDANATHEYSMGTPIGVLTLRESDGRIVSIQHAAPGSQSGGVAPTPLLRQAERELNEYFAGTCKEFTVPLEPGGTAFRALVWDALRSVPYGTAVSYGEIARRVGNPAALRAVGGACGANPILIMIPCHRVVGANGSLTGFAAGVGVKQLLLELEGIR